MDEKLSRLDSALCNFCNAATDNPDNPEYWTEETNRNFVELCASYNEASSLLRSPSPISADAVVEACAKVADEMRIKHGDPVKGVYENGVWDAGVRTAASIRALKGTFPAAPEAKSEVAIKPLVWNETRDHTGHYASANSRIGGYDVFELHMTIRGEQRVIFGWSGHWINGDRKAESFEDAKAAAQADYETRIRSALVDPEGGV